MTLSLLSFTSAYGSLYHTSRLPLQNTTSTAKAVCEHPYAGIPTHIRMVVTARSCPGGNKQACHAMSGMGAGHPSNLPHKKQDGHSTPEAPRIIPIVDMSNSRNVRGVLSCNQ